MAEFRVKEALIRRLVGLWTQARLFFVDGRVDRRMRFFLGVLSLISWLLVCFRTLIHVIRRIFSAYGSCIYCICRLRLVMILLTSEFVLTCQGLLYGLAILVLGCAFV